ncbi:MAG: competence/damage-inducible protein A [Nitrospiraceae bacterium]
MKTNTSFFAETIAIGSELLVGGRTDTNSVFLADELASLGIVLRFKSIVGDGKQDIAQAIRLAVRRVDVVLMTGGLGPTVDDCTREAVASATGYRLVRRREALDMMTTRLAQWGRSPSPTQLRQAMIPSGAMVLNNPVGSAPGFSLIWKETLLFVLPGVPREMEAMVAQEVVPRIQAWVRDHGRRSASPIIRQVFHTFGLPESDVDAKLRGLVPGGAKIDLGLLASPMDVMVSLTTKGTGAPKHRKGGHGRRTEDVLLPFAREIRTRLGDWLFAEGTDTLEEVVGRALSTRGLTLAVAESCTGGLISHRLTQVPGSSVYLERGVVCYSNQSKMDMLGVPEKMLTRYGAVSAEVASAMAKGIRERSLASIGLSVTGIAGPGGATQTKPVGLVYVALDAGTGGNQIQEFHFHGDRSTIKLRSSQAALDLLRRWLITSGQA